MLLKCPLFFCGLEVYFYDLKLLILWDSASIHLAAAASAYALLAPSNASIASPYRSCLAWSQRLVMSPLGWHSSVRNGGHPRQREVRQEVGHCRDSLTASWGG